MNEVTIVVNNGQRQAVKKAEAKQRQLARKQAGQQRRADHPKDEVLAIRVLFERRGEHYRIKGYERSPKLANIGYGSPVPKQRGWFAFPVVVTPRLTQVIRGKSAMARPRNGLQFQLGKGQGCLVINKFGWIHPDFSDLRRAAFTPGHPLRTLAEQAMWKVGIEPQSMVQPGNASRKRPTTVNRPANPGGRAVLPRQRAPPRTRGRNELPHIPRVLRPANRNMNMEELSDDFFMRGGHPAKRPYTDVVAAARRFTAANEAWRAEQRAKKHAVRLRWRNLVRLAARNQVQAPEPVAQIVHMPRPLSASRIELGSLSDSPSERRRRRDMVDESLWEDEM